MNGKELQDSPALDLANLTYLEWEYKRKILWEGYPEIKDPNTKQVIKVAIKGMGSIISKAWSDTLANTNFGNSLPNTGYSPDNSHFGVLEIGEIHLDIHRIQERLRHIGITRENCPDFDEYCRHLESHPKFARVSGGVALAATGILTTDPNDVFRILTDGGTSGL